MEGEWALIPFSEIGMEPFEEWQYMNCPRCGVLVCPYGGFGEGAWADIGKYGCYKKCGLVWYADPVLGEFWDRGPGGRLVRVVSPVSER